MNKNNLITTLYLFNSILLITHEIDSAFWKEWELFGIPGGIQVFLLLNFLLVLVVLIGYKQLLQNARSGYAFALLLAAAGILGFSIHTYFILTGHAEFTLPASLVVLGVWLIGSLGQAAVTLKDWHALSVSRSQS